MDISSVPSEPWTSQALTVPRAFSVSAIGLSSACENAPVSWNLTPAGFVRGPRMLKTVRVPSSSRAGMTCFIAEWCIGAIMKQMPHSSMALCATSAGTITSIPS